MLPENLDRVLFLRYNCTRWSQATVQACLDSSEGEIEEEDVTEEPEEVVVEPLIERIDDEELDEGRQGIEGKIDSLLVSDIVKRFIV